MDHPPEDTYSVTRHPERFAPLLEVARALREYLVATYDVTVDGDRHRAARSRAPPHSRSRMTDFPLRSGDGGRVRH